MNPDKKLACVVVDDDDVSRKLVEDFVLRTPSLQLAGSFAAPQQALLCLSTQPPDILLLDVEMPGMNGLDLIRAVHKLPYVILVTAERNYALDAFELEAGDFLLKPLSYPRFVRAISKALRQLAATPVRPETDAFYIRHQSRYIRLSVDELDWVEAIGDYVDIHLAERRYTIHTTMKALETRLPAESFARVHRSYIVRLGAIREIEENTMNVAGKVLPIGKSYREGLLQRLNLL